MINEKGLLGQIQKEKDKVMYNNSKLLNNGKKSEYRDNCLYLKGMTKTEEIIKNMVVVHEN